MIHLDCAGLAAAISETDVSKFTRLGHANLFPFSVGKKMCILIDFIWMKLKPQSNLSLNVNQRAKTQSRYTTRRVINSENSHTLCGTFAELELKK